VGVGKSKKQGPSKKVCSGVRMKKRVFQVEGSDLYSTRRFLKLGDKLEPISRAEEKKGS